MKVVLKDYVPIQPKPIVRLKVTSGIENDLEYFRIVKQSDPIDYCARKEMGMVERVISVESSCHWNP